MSRIKVNCPKCKQEVAVETQGLSQRQGRVDCVHCAHVFHLVKRSKKQENAQKTVQPENKPAVNYRQPQADEMADIERMFKELDELDTAKTKAKAQASASKSKKPLQYRIPKAPNKRTDFADVGQGFAFNLLDRESVQSQLPQVNIQPAGMPIVAGRTEPQNNITIHTDSLVFTLLGDGQNGMTNLPAAPMMANMPMNPAQMVGMQPMAGAMQPAAISSVSEMNWTVATIAAFLVLIVQLFYLVMMLI